MGTTDINHLPYPELVDPPDIPADMKELADAIEVTVSNLATNLISQLKFPATYRAVRTVNDSVPASTWGNAVSLLVPNVPAGTLLVNSVFHWKSNAAYSWFRTTVNGVNIPNPGVSYIDSGTATQQMVTTLVSSVDYPGGNLTVNCSFGFSAQQVWIQNGSLVTATIFPDAPTI